jgi:hypothetical protein
MEGELFILNSYILNRLFVLNSSAVRLTQARPYFLIFRFRVEKDIPSVRAVRA